jgi:hypothetical protein
MLWQEGEGSLVIKGQDQEKEDLRRRGSERKELRQHEKSG